MKSGKKVPPFLAEAIVRLADGSITSDVFARLDRELATNDEALAYYLEFMTVTAGLLDQQGALAVQVEEDLAVRPDSGQPGEDRCGFIEQYAREQLNRFLEQEHAHENKVIRPMVHRDWVEFKNDLLNKLQRSWRTGVKVARVAVISSLAAVLLLLFGLYAWEQIPVARLESSVEARWDEDMQAGMDLRRGEFRLEKGFAKLVMRKGAEVILQAPSSIELLSGNRLWVESAWLTAKVPPQASGFTVETPSLNVIDFGTEFGLRVDTQKNLELHVFDGAVDLQKPSGRDRPVTKRRVNQGRAVIVNPDGHAAQWSVDHRPPLFLRALDPMRDTSKPIEMNLSDIVGGGNGFGSGQLGYGVHPLTGALAIGDVSYASLGTGEYLPVSWSDFIDGVFVPRARVDQIISTQGHRFRECPPTDRYVLTPVQNGGLIHTRSYRAKMTWNGEILGTDEAPCILIHSNLGITFDLRSIRASLSGFQIQRFRSKFGICEHPERTQTYVSNSEFWVLVDDEVRFHRQVVAQKGPVGAIDVLLEGDSRFLTLVTSDAGDPRPRPGGRWNAGDWCLFVEPVLEMFLIDNPDTMNE